MGKASMGAELGHSWLAAFADWADVFRSTIGPVRASVGRHDALLLDGCGCCFPFGVRCAAAVAAATSCRCFSPSFRALSALSHVVGLPHLCDATSQSMAVARAVAVALARSALVLRPMVSWQQGRAAGHHSTR